MRRLVPTLAVLLAVAAGVGTGSAQAHHLNYTPAGGANPSPVYSGTSMGPNGRPMLSTAAMALVDQHSYSPAVPGWHPGPSTTTTIPSTINKVQRASRFSPAIRQMGALALTSGVFLVGTKIGDGLGGFVYKKLTGESYAPGTPTDWYGGTSLTWGWIPYYTGGVATNPGYPSTSVPGSYTGTGWTTTNVAFVFGYWVTATPTTFDVRFCQTATAPCSADRWSGVNLVNNVPAPKQQALRASSTDCSSVSTTCAITWRTEAQMEDAVDKTENISAAEWAALPAPAQKTITYAPRGTATTADREAAADALGADGSQTPAQQATEAALACELDADCEEVNPFTFVLPKPNLNETYDAYIDRLEALGAIGTITATEVASAVEGYGPEAVVRVIDQATGAVYDPLRWPTTSPTLTADTNLTVRYNPGTAVEVPTEGGGGGSAGEGLTFPAIDSPCDKFPFGVFCWFGEAAGDLLGAEAVPPAVTFPAMDFGEYLGVSVTTPALELDAADLPAPFETLIAVLRTVLTFLVWFVGLWFAGTRLMMRRNEAEVEGVPS